MRRSVFYEGTLYQIFYDKDEIVNFIEFIRFKWNKVSSKEIGAVIEFNNVILNNSWSSDKARKQSLMLLNKMKPQVPEYFI